MASDILDEVQRLRREQRPFALATVVVAEHPTSGTLGARAIVAPNGQMTGWLGGSCVQPTIRHQALAALADGSPRLVVLAPEQGAAPPPKPGIVQVPMTCASQGGLQVYVEPFLPKVELVIVGASPVARTLASFGSLLDFEVCACAPDAETESVPEVGSRVERLEDLRVHLTVRSYVVVATMGAYDEEALEAILDSPASYVGLVASLRRLAAVADELRRRGRSEEQLARIKRPEGLTANTLVPAEIALSAIVELLDVRRQGVGLWAGEALAEVPEAIDPICGMAVEIATARYRSTRDGETYYFCAASCKAAFERG